MQIYLVGGAVRDSLLGLPVKENDWVVVGATPRHMLAQGFIAVGKDFPVFLHPKTHEEYALARTERKTAKGYKGFIFHADADVTLEQDLQRRDLTINAIAKTEKGELIDPYGGQADIKKKLFRHISPAFAEDPVRILRVARLACRLTDFTVFTETNEFMRQMVRNGEVDALVAERVWQEFSRALTEKAPQRFFEVLDGCDALATLFPEINTAKQGVTALQNAAAVTVSGEQRFAALCHALSEIDLIALCRRLRITNSYRDLALLVIKHASAIKHVDCHDAKAILSLLKKLDALRRPQRFKDWQAVLQIISEQEITQRQQILTTALDAIAQLDTRELQGQGLSGPEFGRAIEELQLQQIRLKIL